LDGRESHVLRKDLEICVKLRIQTGIRAGLGIPAPFDIKPLDISNHFIEVCKRAPCLLVNGVLGFGDILGRYIERVCKTRCGADDALTRLGVVRADSQL